MTFTITRVAAVIAVILVGVLVVLTVIGPWVADDSESSDSVALREPRLLAPSDGAEFVESDVVLHWDWPQGLDSDQQFAVRVWYDEVEPREVWTVEPWLNVQNIVDGFMQEIGPFHWQVAVITVADGGGFEAMASEWSAVRTLQRVRRLSVTPAPETAWSAAARMVSAQVPANSTGLIDHVRDFVSTNSNDAAQDSFEADYSDALDLIAAHAAGEGDPPRLLCDGQATAALTLLAELGLESRLIFLYGDNAGQVQEHTLLEVFNPAHQQWELHDVLSNMYFVDENGDRASIERLVFGALDLVSVCTTDGHCTRLPEAGYGFDDLFEAFRYGYSETFWVNPDRFDVTKRFRVNDYRNLAEYLTGNPRDFVFRFDNWVTP